MLFRIITALLISLCFSLNATNYTKYERIPMLSELPNNEILNLFQDSDGYLWIATTNGLYCFNGYSIKTYKSNIYNFNLLSNNRITCINEDHNKNIIIGTDKGVNILNKVSGKISHFDTHEISKTYIASIAVAANNDIWIGTDIGLYKYNIKTNKFTKLLYFTIKGLCVGHNGDIWIGSWNNGLRRYSYKQGKIIKYPQINAKKSAHVIYEDSKNNVWVGSFGLGLSLLHNAYNINNLSWITFTNKDNSINDNFIYSITENKKTNTLWIGTRTGTSTLSLSTPITSKSWNSYCPTIDGNSTLFNEVDAIINDKQENIILGSLGGGICMINTNSSDFKTNYMNNVYSMLNTNSVRCIHIDNNNNLWAGIGNKGIIRENMTTGKLDVFSNINLYNNKDEFTKIQSIISSKHSNQILIGSLNGIYTIDTSNPLSQPTLINDTKLDKYATTQIINALDGGYWIVGTNIVYYLDKYLQHTVCISKDIIKYNSILQTSPNTLWVGSQTDGAIRYTINPITHKAISKHIYNYAHSCPSTTNVTCLYQDSKHRIWAGTNGAGICLYMPKADKFVSLNLVMNFPTDYVSSIIEGKDGNLWLASNVGIIRLTPTDKLEDSKISIFNEAGNSYLRNSVFADNDGNIYFGTHHGYVYFNPMNLKSNENEFKVHITDIKLDNKSINTMDSTEETVASSMAGYCEQINIPYSYSNIMIEFSAMRMLSNNKIRYTYILEGYDKDWHYATSNNHSANYANLPAGKYIFKVKSTNGKGEWNDEFTSLEINVIPPFWKTWWAYCIYFIITVFIIYHIIRFQRQHLRLKTEIKIQQIQQDKENELGQTKLRFFTNITHELFTPITIIFAAIQEISDKIPSKELSIITSNTNRLEKLIQQILEFRKSETGNLKLQVSEHDIVSIVAKNVESFVPLMNRKNINLVYNHVDEHLNVIFDTDKIDKILYNLLSNALKYNKPCATVTVTLTNNADTGYITLSVMDNGEGLSKNTMNNLFKRFYDGDFRKFHTYGNGIGLSLVKDLVTLHKGTITVDNNPGANFIIKLPVFASAYSKDEYQSSIKSPMLDINNSQSADSSTENSTCNDVDRRQNVIILVVEDEPDLNGILVKTLSQYYKVVSATNGKEALEILNTEDIQLVVSDVMMPEMDGYELCKAIKENTQLNHIPVILLTAKIQEEDVIEAYGNGADGYIKKPFSLKVLKARIDNLLTRREQNIQMFKQDDMFDPKELNYTNVEEEFLTLFMECINSNYTNPDFDQDTLAQNLCVSKSTLNRKIKALTGMSASNILKDTRLKSANKLLQEQPTLRISDLAYMVGFNDPKYFSTCFKKKFGKLPRNNENIND